MNAIIAVQDLIKQNQSRIKILKQQLKDHHEGVSKLSAMAEASTEMGLEKSEEALQKNELILKELQKRDLLDHDVDIEDDEIFAIAEATINLNLRIHSELYDELLEIQKDWAQLQQGIDSQSIDKLGMLNVHIPILVLHLSVLVENIQENIEENDLAPFKGLPAFEDWWITELWTNHQAYFGLYKWRAIITSLCITADQKRAWNSIFSNWVFIKKLLNEKGSLGYEYNYSFDTLIEHHTQLIEELDTKNLISMEKIVETITAKEDFSKYKAKHVIETGYLKFKRDKKNYKVE